MDQIEKIMKHIKETGGLEPCDDVAIVCNDAIVVVSMDEERNISVNVLLGEPERLDITFDMLEKKE